MKTLYGPIFAFVAAGALLAASPNVALSAEVAKDVKCRGCVGARDLGKKSVKKKHIRPNAITSSAIADGAVGPDDLADTAKPGGGNFSGDDQDIALTATDTIVRSVTIVAPAAGIAIVNASGYGYANTIADALARCSITTGNSLDSNAFIYMRMDGTVMNSSDAFGATRGFDVAAGSNTYNLVCDGTTGAPHIADTNMTAIFLPQTY